MWIETQLVQQGTLSAEAFADAVSAHFESRPALGKMAMSAGKLSMSQVFEVLQEQAISGDSFGSIAVRKKFITKTQINRLLIAQAEQATPLREILIERGQLTPYDYVEFQRSSHCSLAKLDAKNPLTQTIAN